MKSSIWSPFLLASLLHATPSLAAPCTVEELNGNTVLSQFEFSWEVLGTGHQTGSFATGDCWILGPVTIVSIQPASTNVSGRIRNGSQVNPGSSDQGYDNAMDRIDYQASLNVSPNLTGNDLTLTIGSVLSTLSKPEANARPQLEAAAVLTVLETTPPAGAFRPPYVGSDKSIPGTVADLDYSILRQLAPPSDPPDICELEGDFERVWIEQKTSWTGRWLHPSRNQPDYGREIASDVGEALLTLNLNYRDEDKEPLLIRLVQYGIDIYGAARVGEIWPDNGGHNHGRKMPLILAGLALGNPSILEYADATRHFIFQEDRQTFYVSAEDVAEERYDGDSRLREPYTDADIGMPEWGEKHTQSPERDGRNWNVAYRDIVGSSIIGHVLAAEMMGVEGLWNHPPLFDYIERFYEIEKSEIGPEKNDLNPFEASMYREYGAGRVPEQDPPVENRPRPCGTIPSEPSEDCVFNIP